MFQEFIKLDPICDCYLLSNFPSVIYFYSLFARTQAAQCIFHLYTYQALFGTNITFPLNKSLRIKEKPVLRYYSLGTSSNYVYIKQSSTGGRK